MKHSISKSILFDLIDVFELKRMNTAKLHILMNIVWVWMGVKKATFQTPQAFKKHQLFYLQNKLGLHVQKISTPMVGDQDPKPMLWISKSPLPYKISSHEQVGRLLGYLTPIDDIAATNLGTGFLRITVGKNRKEFILLSEKVYPSASTKKIKKHLNKFVRSFNLFQHPFDYVIIEYDLHDASFKELIEF